MYCIKTEIPQEICDIDDELKAIYHSRDTVCIWVLKSREDRIVLWMKLLECLKMKERNTLNLFINNLQRNLI
jgi:hypothetical protein